MPQSRLAKLLGLLKKQYGTPKSRVGERDPFRLIIGEMVAYLAKDDLRERAFDALRKQVGLSPQDILDAPLATLTAICRLGGPVAPQHRAERMQLAAAIVIDDFGGDLTSVLTWEYKKAVRALCTLPSVAEPGADRILMACGARPEFGLESAALRVLCRLGYGEETGNYHKTTAPRCEVCALSSSCDYFNAPRPKPTSGLFPRKRLHAPSSRRARE